MNNTRAILKNESNILTANFYDIDKKTLLYSYELIYGSEIAMPNHQKLGYNGETVYNEVMKLLGK